MTQLTEFIRIAPRFARSANLERDATRLEPLDGYVVTARALDVIERLAGTAVRGGAGGAWSLTGPYGSGKSSLGLLVDAAFGPSGSTRKAAIRLIGEASGEAAQLVETAHLHHNTVVQGFHRGIVTATREPLNRTVLRALHSAVRRGHADSHQTKAFAGAEALNAALEDAASDDAYRVGPAPTALVEIARALAADRPLILILDEFGKNLEAIGDRADSDPYLLQQLAEAGQGAGLPIFLLTMQHLSFEDHLSHASELQRREWAKVQGRFDDVAYVESATQTRALIGSAFEIHEASVADRIDRWSRREAAEMRRLGISEMANPGAVAACYPLHPLTAVVLPELCSRYGQHERTLFSFLTGSNPASAASFVRSTAFSRRGSLPSVGLDALYDYFVGAAAGTPTVSGRSSRWTEIATRLRDTHGLSGPQRRLAKSVAVLNLIATTGIVRASAPILARTGRSATRALDELEAAGVLTYRSFADEYRLWQGTDVDLANLLERAREETISRALVDLLSEIDPLTPQVAARHSAEHDTLRVFVRRYVDSRTPVTPPDVFSPYDGELVVVIGGEQRLPQLSQPSSGEQHEGAPAAKPVVAAIPGNISALEDAAREVGTVTTALENPSVTDDWVARSELGERLALARRALANARDAALDSTNCRWVLLDGEGGRNLGEGRGSAPLSEAADLTYTSSPPVGNEMLNRMSLTSQGAKARRLLLTAMIEHGNERDVALSGFGPEVAMYRSFLARAGIHVPSSNGTMVFNAPTDSRLRPAWDVFTSQMDRSKHRRVNLDDVFAALRCPPVGMKAAVIPVLVTAGLLARTDDVAIYEHGTFKPVLTADLSERMVRNPGHFDIKAFANTSGARLQVVEALAKILSVRATRSRQRVANVVTIVAALVTRVRLLDNYARRTASLSGATRGVREALFAATEPDELVFDTLPSALGLPPVPPAADTYAETSQYANALSDALDELDGCFHILLADLQDLLLASAGEVSRLAIAGQAAALDGEVLNTEMRAFVGALANESAERDLDWMATIATVVARKAPAEWIDPDASRFCQELPQWVAAFLRLAALHADHRADGGGPFDALRVTVTRSDGSEYVRLVGIDQRQKDRIESVLDSALSELTNLTGSENRAGHSLLAVLGERLLGECPDVAGRIGRQDAGSSRERQAQHG